MDSNLRARFGGMFVLGDQDGFRWNRLVGGPAWLDEFLGNAPGTTTLLNQPSFVCTGSFTAATEELVQDGLDTLLSLASLSFPLGLPTDEKFPANYVFAANLCYFLPSEFVPSAIAPAPGNRWSATYRIAFRQAGH